MEQVMKMGKVFTFLLMTIYLSYTVQPIPSVLAKLFEQTWFKFIIIFLTGLFYVNDWSVSSMIEVGTVAGLILVWFEILRRM